MIRLCYKWFHWKIYRPGELQQFWPIPRGSNRRFWSKTHQTTHACLRTQHWMDQTFPTVASLSMFAKHLLLLLGERVVLVIPMSQSWWTTTSSTSKQQWKPTALTFHNRAPNKKVKKTIVLCTFERNLALSLRSLRPTTQKLEKITRFTVVQYWYSSTR